MPGRSTLITTGLLTLLVIGAAFVYLPELGGLWQSSQPLDADGEFVYITDLDFWQRTPRERAVVAKAHFDLDHDLIAVAAPLRISARILEALAEVRPRGVVFDIGSLKSPLRTALYALRSAGVRVTSIHPMFGPDTELLSGRHVIFIDLGVPEATERVRELFASTMATQVDMDLDSHDRLVAYILGLSHALNIAFFTALAESGEEAARLAQLSSTTFDAQIEVARRVASENPHLYFEIQALNDFGLSALQALRDAVERLHTIVAGRDEEAFAALMQQGERYLRTVPERLI